MRSIGLMLVVVAAAASVAAIAAPQPGTLDKSFSGNGRASVNVVPRASCGSGAHSRRAAVAERRASSCEDAASSVTVDSQGRIVLAGRIASSVGSISGIVRYLPNGTRDSTFARNGIKRLRGAGYEVFCDSQDRIVLGPTYGGDIVRLSSDGSIDGSFADHGGLHVDNAAAITIDSSDRVLVASMRKLPAGADSGIVLSRYLADGSKDPSFDDSQTVELDEGALTDPPRAVVVDPDGGILVAGGIDSFDDPQSRGLAALAKFLPTGGLDSTFGEGGTLVARGPYGFDLYDAVAVDRVGRIVAGGSGFVDRYLPNGDQDDSFAGDGRLESAASSIAIDEDNRIVTAQGRVRRFKENGTPNWPFGNRGVAEADKVHANQAIIDRNGNIVSAGAVESRYTNPPSTDFAVARHLGG